MIDPSFLSQFELDLLTIENFGEIAGEMTSLFRMLDKHPSQVSVLDYGFGYARWARVATAIGAKVFGAEISPDKISLAQSLGIEVISTEDLPSMRFDIVHTEQVFEHLVEPRIEFEKLSNLLTCGGIMKVAVPRQGNIRRHLKSGITDKDYESMLPVGALEHLNAFSHRSMEVLAQSQNTKLVTYVRRQAIFFDLSDVARSLTRLAKVMLRSFRRDSGYYLFRGG
jgi:SAM-dependent methyltransferase